MSFNNITQKIPDKVKEEMVPNIPEVIITETKIKNEDIFYAVQSPVLDYINSLLIKEGNVMTVVIRIGREALATEVITISAGTKEELKKELEKSLDNYTNDLTNIGRPVVSIVVEAISMKGGEEDWSGERNLL